MKKLMILILFTIGCSSPHIYTPRLSGDCVDRVIKIRQELRLRGYKAEIILGKIKKENSESEGHAWVVYKNKKTGEWIRINNY